MKNKISAISIFALILGLVQSCKVTRTVTTVRNGGHVYSPLGGDFDVKSDYHKGNITIDLNKSDLSGIDNFFISLGNKDTLVDVSSSQSLRNIKIEIILLAAEESFITDFEKSSKKKKDGSSFYYQLGRTGIDFTRGDNSSPLYIHHCYTEKRNGKLEGVAGLCLEKIKITYPKDIFSENQSLFVNSDRKLGSNQLTLKQIKVLENDGANVEELIVDYLKTQKSILNKSEIIELIELASLSSEKEEIFSSLLNSNIFPTTLKVSEAIDIYETFSLSSTKMEILTSLEKRVSFSDFSIAGLIDITDSFSLSSNKEEVISNLQHLIKNQSMSLDDLNDVWNLFSFSSTKLEVLDLLINKMNKNLDNAEKESLIERHFSFDSDKSEARRKLKR